MNPENIPATLKLLVIDDDESYLSLMEEVLAQPGVTILKASGPEEGLALYRQHRPPIILTDMQMPAMDGMAVMDEILGQDPGAEVLLMTGYYTYEAAVDAIKKGAADYLPKPLNLVALRERVRSALEDARLRQRAADLEVAMVDTFQFEGIVGRSAPMLNVFSLIRRVAPHFRSVLVSGATGTGKELAARAIHRLSTVRNKPFIVCNCAAIVETLFESELFGHVKGSFTGAVNDRIGMFEAADGGVLFLDEIGEVPLKMQAKLLRALQNGEVQRVGATIVRRVEVRVIAATNRDLRALAKINEFREDLYFRLAMLEVKLPSLADRREDIPLLEPYFLRKFSKQIGREFRGLSRRAQMLLSRYTWPGNIRELENVIGHACTMARSDLIDIEDLPEHLRSGQQRGEDRTNLTLDEVILRHVLHVYEYARHNKQLAAEILGISRATLYRYLGENKGTNQNG